MDQKKQNQEPFFLSMLPFAGLGLLLLLALLWRYLPSGKDPGTSATTQDLGKAVIDMWEQSETMSIEIAESDFTLGPADAPVTIVEFSDFQCPYCRTGVEGVKEVLAAHPNEVRLVFKDYPLDMNCNETLTQQLHPLACRAAVVARCAGEAGPEQFWKAHDVLFGAPQISEELLASIPVELSLPAEAYESCLASGAALERVKEHIQQGRTLAVNGTPAFFINGRAAADYREGRLLRVVEHILAGKGES